MGAVHCCLSTYGREFNIFVNVRALLFYAEPTYLGRKLDRALTFRRHLESLHRKLTPCVGVLRRLARSSWCADTTILRTVTLALVHSTADSVPVWCRSVHTRLIYKAIKNA